MGHSRRLQRRLALLSCLFLSVCTRTAQAQASGPQPCSFPSLPQHLPLPRCPAAPGRNWTAEDAGELAWRVAPILYMHPKEPFRLQSPPAYFEAAEAFFQDFRNASQTAYQFLAELPFWHPLAMEWGTRQFITVLNSSKVSSQQAARILGGAEVNPDGLSTAEVYYTAFEPSPDLWGFTFHLFYAFNGCSQQMFTLGVNSTAEVLDMRVCPFGTHEADWERISVLACKADGAIMQVAYSQHSWAQVLDCERGQCPMEDGRPVAYVALETHANYPFESPFVVYEMVNPAVQNISLVNLGGLYLGDRTKADPRLKFMPSPDNIVPIPALETILEGGLSEWEWALFGGVWGGPLQPSGVLMECYFDNQTRAGACQEGHAKQAYEWGLQFFKKLPFFGGDGTSASDWTVKPPTNSTFYSDTVQGSGILGPLTRSYSHLWLPEVGAPVLAYPPQALVCPGSLAAKMPYRATAYSASVSTLIGYLAGVSGGCAMFAMLMTALLALPALLDKRGGMGSLAVLRLQRLKRQAGETVSRRWRGGTGAGAGEDEGTAAGKRQRLKCDPKAGPGSKGQASPSDRAANVAASKAEVGSPLADGTAVVAVVAAAGLGSPAAAPVLGGGALIGARHGSSHKGQGKEPEQPPATSAPLSSGATREVQLPPLRKAPPMRQGGCSQPGSPLSPTQRLRTSELEAQPLQPGKRVVDRSSFPSSSPGSQSGVGAAAAAAAAAVVAAAVQPPPGAQQAQRALPAHGHSPPGSAAFCINPLPQPQLQQGSASPRHPGATQQEAREAELSSAPTPNPLLLLGTAGSVWQSTEQQLQQQQQQQLPLQPGGTPGPCGPEAAPRPAPASPGPEPVLTAVVQQGRGVSKQHLAWAATGFLMYFAAIGFMAHGTHELYRLGDEVRQYARALYAVLRLLKITVAVGLSLMGLFDITAVFFLFFAMPRARQACGAGGRRRRFYGWVQENSHAIHVAMAGLLLSAISLAMVLFGIGMVTLVAQLAMQLLCSAVSRVTLTSIPLESLCVSLPLELAVVLPGLSRGTTVVCIWELINVCFFLSELLVWDLVVGSALLLWSHLVFLVLVITSMWLTYKFSLVL